MKILIVTATYEEVLPFARMLVKETPAEKNNLQHYFFKGKQIDILITGVGMTATAYYLGKIFAVTRYDMALNTGIAGSFDYKFRIGEVCNVVIDSFPESGAEDGDDFLPVHQLGLTGMDDFPFIKGKLFNTGKIQNAVLASLPAAEGITVNTVHGNNESIKKITRRTSAQTESMEGAAFFYACLLNDIPFAQIRSISNYVEQRNKNRWNIPLAIENLNKKVAEIIG